MRVSKTHEERKNEILDVAEKLFMYKGYNKTSVRDLITEIDIAKGTFYYYFKSKEEVMQAVVKRYVEQQAEIYNEISNDKSINAIQKLKRMLEISNEIQKHDKKQLEMLEMVHSSNAEIHMLSISESIQVLIPIVAKVIEEGNMQKIFNCEYPNTSAEVVVTSLQILFNDDFIQASHDELEIRLFELSKICEKIFGTEKGSLSFMFDICKEMLS